MERPFLDKLFLIDRRAGTYIGLRVATTTGFEYNALCDRLRAMLEPKGIEVQGRFAEMNSNQIGRTGPLDGLKEG